MHRYLESVKVAAMNFQTQNSVQIEIRRSADLHDRVIFIDAIQCWVLGTSIKDAAAKKPTYLAPLAEDLVAEKMRIYDDLWHTAIPI
jgi:uncharacterized protein (UPF0303 family)